MESYIVSFTYPTTNLTVEISLVTEKLHHVIMATLSCQMQESPLTERRNPTSTQHFWTLGPHYVYTSELVLFSATCIKGAVTKWRSNTLLCVRFDCDWWSGICATVHSMYTKQTVR